jgi:hypothetical protein
MTAIIMETALAEHTVRVIFFTGTPSFASALCDTMFPGAVLKLLGDSPEIVGNPTGVFPDCQETQK